MWYQIPESHIPKKKKKRERDSCLCGPITVIITDPTKLTTCAWFWVSSYLHGQLCCNRRFEAFVTTFLLRKAARNPQFKKHRSKDTPTVTANLEQGVQSVPQHWRCSMGCSWKIAEGYDTYHKRHVSYAQYTIQQYFATCLPDSCH